MKILANENVAGAVVTALQKDGHDVAWIRTDSPGAPDSEVLARAVREVRLLVTFDKDFGELVWREGKEASPGIVLFRISMPSSGIAAAKVATALSSHLAWFGHFSVVDDRRIRMVPLPVRHRR